MAYPGARGDRRPRRTGDRLALFVTTEIVLLALYRDNLILNVTMQFVPIKAVEAWQQGG